MITNIVNRVLGKGGRRGAGMGMGMGKTAGTGGSGATGAGTGGSTRDAAIGRGVRSLLRRVR
ncbi:hypothetical protein [Nocardioides massiliensis]|uniref:Uncharacterized protein n=1 Tax=Nocardioides massiliensis TaxID=1325935 RepID=A0ABT9NRB4_9ACTN|nr:hypothetical protein [Nocardioides massiliensis]MDP9822971.1 hypothetical protein [Nocardioides massiliensis]